MLQRSLCLLASLLLLAWLPARLHAAPSDRLFPETGWRVGGTLLAFWEAGGGLPVFGLPLGPEHISAAGLHIQQFERARLELHPEHAAPYDVELGRLGADLLAGAGRDWQRETGTTALTGPCVVFAETGREVCGSFLAYWRGHGLELGDAGASWRESLALFGLPLTPATVEPLPSGEQRITQWFERARFEYHPANPDPYTVLLGRLGAELAGEPPPLPRPIVDLAPRSAIVQGHTLQIDVQIADAVSVAGALGDTRLTFTRGRSGWTALGAVGALQPPQLLTLSVEAMLPDGRTSVTTVALQVVNAHYPVERVDLPQDVRDSLARNGPALAEERARVNAIWPIVTPEKLWDGRFAMPAAGTMVSHFGVGRAYNSGPVDSYHEGLDIKNSAGTPIVAPARGRVALAEPNFVARGGAVILDHGRGVHTGYWHMERVVVAEGQLVAAGEMIGSMGARGMATGPHLHWEVHIGPISVDPLEWVEQEWLTEH
jgi:hypothetical protein